MASWAHGQPGTNANLARWGYQVPPWCGRCGAEEPDDDEHRLLRCAYAAAVREASGILATNLPRCPLAWSGWMRAPDLADLWPTQFDRREEFALVFRVDGRVGEMFEFELGLDIYGDGSCL